MESAIKWLKASYIIGASADGLIGVLMLIPARMGEEQFRLPMGLAASLMFGWTVLLVWAYQRPMERRGILLLTIFPVICGLLVSAGWAAAQGLVPPWEAVPLMAMGGAIMCLMGFSYRKAAIAARREVG